MNQIMRCPLTGVPCTQPIRIEEKAYFLAEPKEPEKDRERRWKAIRLVLGEETPIQSALEEKEAIAFTCKICRMIQSCAYGIADITNENPNVILELGMMIALGKPTIILCRKGTMEKLKLPSDLIDREVIPFEEYIDIIENMGKMVATLPPVSLPPSPIEETEKELSKVNPQLAKEVKEALDKHKEEIVREFEERMPARDKRIMGGLTPDLMERLSAIDESLRRLERIGSFAPDAETAVMRADFYNEKEEYKAAVAQCDWALALKPEPETAAHAWFEKGYAFTKLLEYEKAIESYKAALEIEPGYLRIIENLAEVYLLAENYPEAEKLAREALEKSEKVDDRCASFYLLFSGLHLQGKRDKAEQILDELVKYLKGVKGGYEVGWDFSDITPALERLESPAREMVDSIIALLLDEITLEEFLKRRHAWGKQARRKKRN